MLNKKESVMSLHMQFVFVKLITLFLCFMGFVFSAFAQTDDAEIKKDFTKVKLGMSEAQVKKVVGNPEIIDRFKTVKRGTKDTSTYWRYENNLTIIFKNHYVLGLEKNHSVILQSVQEWADPKNKDSLILLYK